MKMDVELVFVGLKLKKCSVCQKKKELFCFSKQSSAKCGLNSQCKQCRSVQRKEVDVPRPKSGVCLCQDCKIKRDVSCFSSDKSRSTGLQTYCKDCQRKQSNELKKKRNNYEDFVHFLFKDLKNNAKRRGIGVCITKEDILELYEGQERLCALTGDLMTYNFKAGEGRGSERTSKNISVDRIDPKKEYTRDNIQLVCNRVNTIKWDLTQEEFIYFCTKVVEYVKKKR